MNAKASVFVIWRVEAIKYLLLYNLHDCTFTRIVISCDYESVKYNVALIIVEIL